MTQVKHSLGFPGRFSPVAATVRKNASGYSVTEIWTIDSLGDVYNAAWWDGVGGTGGWHNGFKVPTSNKQLPQVQGGDPGKPFGVKGLAAVATDFNHVYLFAIGTNGALWSAGKWQGTGATGSSGSSGSWGLIGGINETGSGSQPLFDLSTGLTAISRDGLTVDTYGLLSGWQLNSTAWNGYLGNAGYYNQSSNVWLKGYLLPLSH